MRNQVDKFEEVSIRVYQDFMKLAVVKYNKIVGKSMDKDFDA